MTRRVIAMLAAAALAFGPAPAMARTAVQSEVAVAARLVEVGTWEFTATRRGPDGKSECRETWTFNADGTGLIISGEQRVTTLWSIKQYQGIGQFVFLVDVSSTAGPDCLGAAVDISAYPRSMNGFELLFYADGEGALVCWEAAEKERADGSRFRGLELEDCWGRIVPAARP